MEYKSRHDSGAGHVISPIQQYSKRPHNHRLDGVVYSAWNVNMTYTVTKQYARAGGSNSI